MRNVGIGRPMAGAHEHPERGKLMPELRNEGIVELTESELSDVRGGLLLPAVQKVREAAGRMSSAATDGTVIAAG
jgi:hypothetical protein